MFFPDRFFFKTTVQEKTNYGSLCGGFSVIFSYYVVLLWDIFSFSMEVFS